MRKLATRDALRLVEGEQNRPKYTSDPTATGASGDPPPPTTDMSQYEIELGLTYRV